MNASKRPQIETYLSTLPRGWFLLNEVTAKKCGIGIGTLHRNVKMLIFEGKVIRNHCGYLYKSNQINSTEKPNGSQVEVKWK